MGANGNKKDTKKFAQEVENITNGEYTLTGEYIYSNIETTIKHNICQKEFVVKPVNFCRKEKYIRCPYCSTATNKRLTTEEYIKKVNKISRDFQVIGEYIDNHTKIKMKHICCGREFNIVPNHFLTRQNCPICSREQVSIKNTKTKQQFIDEMYNLVKNEYKLIGEYKNSKTKIELLHTKCNHIWEVIPSTFLYGIRCPYCLPNHSKMEDNLIDFIKQNYPQYTIKKLRKTSSTKNKRYEIDIFIPELNIGFEYNGTYWHSTMQKSNDYHKEKQQFFKENGISLYFLWEFWGEIKCKNIITHILSKDSQIEEFPYIEVGTKYLYANKDLYPDKPPYIKGYRLLGEVTRKRNIKITINKNFDIYNSGYYQYIKQ